MVDAKTAVSALVHAKARETCAGLVAKKDFVIRHNEYYREIKKGDDLGDVPRMFCSNLKTEQVI